MSFYAGWKILKFLGLSLLVVGSVAPAFVRSLEDRARLYSTAAMGWLVLWIAGYGLLKVQGLALSEPWAIGGMFWSSVAVTASLVAIQRPAAAGVAAFALFAGLVTMVQRDGLTVWMAAGLAPGGVVGALGWWRGSVGVAPSSWGWFRAIAWAEGTSLLALVGVYMPAKYALEIELDGGQGWFGWVHGMLFVLYVVALGRWVLERHRGLGDRSRAMLMGIVASTMPFGSFVYERISRFERSGSDIRVSYGTDD